MLRVGLTGGIGAGKSAVARRLARHGAVIIDSDLLAREVVEPGTPGLAEVVAAFGAGVLTADGALDRPALAAKVFGDDEARRRLEKIIHPRVRRRAADLHAEAGPEAIVVNDIPLLVETGQTASFHLVIVVEATREARVARLVKTRGMTEEQATARIAAQAGDAQRRPAADILLINDGSLGDLEKQVDAIVKDRLLPYERNVRTGTSARPPRDLRIAEPDPRWPATAERIMARIRHALRDHPPTTVSHIGSTAVPELPAKDIIDLMLAVRTLDEADELAGVLGAAGLPRRAGEWADNARGLPGETWPKRLHGSADPGQPVNLHVRVAGSPGWRFALLMRDHLRSVPEAREGYAAAKAAWAQEHKDRFTYGEAKEPWFDEEALAADEWAEATGWQPS
ncbi:dephospho-CoA kinase [Actinoplanes sp. CA-054009]